LKLRAGLKEAGPRDHRRFVRQEHSVLCVAFHPGWGMGGGIGCILRGNLGEQKWAVVKVGGRTVQIAEQGKGPHGAGLPAGHA